MNCPCGRNKKYDECCGLVHQDINFAKTSEDLMRSRYSAFVLAKGEYLMKSQHSSTRNLEDKEELEKWARSVQWEKLKVITTKLGGEHDMEGTVEFKAYYRQGIYKQVIHENSKFVRENGHWVYLGEV